ncbi:DeoR family transcriptional regulator, partial [Mycolicibacterium frederiksbergense]
MDSDSRQRQIVEFARHRGRVEVPALAEELQVATETIRR